MPNDERKIADRTKRDEELKDIEASLDRAIDSISSSKTEIARSRRLMRESDDAQDARDRDGQDGTD